MQTDQSPRFIHMLYVPTMACNMACRYCYLEDNTVALSTEHGSLETLKYMVEKCESEGVIPFNISLHGGEVTTLGKQEFRDLIAYISEYYESHRPILEQNGFKIGRPHIKTNLFDLGRHIDTIREFEVSVSGSLDLPFTLHDEYRVTKGGAGTLERILENVAMLQDIPNSKKVSATIFREHYLHTDEIIQDIWTLHKETCLDMNDFNFMVGFEYNSNGLLHAMTEEEQLDFYQRIYDAFIGTELEPGLKGPWFAEFGPGYCTNCTNCGSKFYLLEKNGDVYSCVRGQKNPDFYYGNIYDLSMAQITANAEEKIRTAHREAGFSEKCAACEYLYICKTGCPFVKKSSGSSTSYTCLLQNKLYEMWALDKDFDKRSFLNCYICEMHPALRHKYALPMIPRDVPNLYSIIENDARLKYIYAPDVFLLEIDGDRFFLESQIIKENTQVAFITPESVIRIFAKKKIFYEHCDYPANNSLFIQLLSGDMITYGDEGRTKQRHIANEMIYTGVMEPVEIDGEEYLSADISAFLHRYGPLLQRSEQNNLFFTTNELRDYHYTKHKNNAYYHIQAINLPFQNINFRYLTAEDFEGEL